MHVKVTIEKGSNERDVIIPIIESLRSDCKYAVKSRGAGTHFKTKKGVETYFERKFPTAKKIVVEI